MDDIAKCAELIASATHTIALTGAGISVESGVPAFRGKGGLWSKYPVQEYATYSAFVANPRKVWAFFKDLYRIVNSATPNPAHLALAKLEKAQKLASIITQNIDDLHQRAGSKKVIEFHGTGRELVCLKCGRTTIFSEELLQQEVPSCACGGILKPQIVLFGEPIPPRAISEAQDQARRCDVMLVVGTSAQVMPASMLPVLAKEGGAKVIEMNVEETVLSGDVADLSVMGPVGETLPKVVDLVVKGYINSDQFRWS